MATQPQPEIAPVSAVVAMVHVADVERSIEFYRLLGFEPGNWQPREGRRHWAWLYQPNAPNWKTGANLMLATSDKPVVADSQRVLFYLYAADLPGLRSELLAKGYKPGEISYPEYLPKGECQLLDPDGYVLMLAQSYEGSP